MNILEELERQTYSAGETIFECGDAGDCAYLIEKGSVEVVADQQDKEVRLSVLKKGELFGEAALIDDGPRTATARTLKKTVLIPLPRSLVHEQLEKSGPVLNHLLFVLLERSRHNPHPATPLAAPDASGPGEVQRTTAAGEATGRFLVNGMAQALELDEFVLHYQPVCELETLQVVGFEALIRWQHPVRGLIPPEDFLWLAGQAGMERQLGIWTLKQACRDWGTLQNIVSPVRPFVSVNISPAQLDNDEMISSVKSILARGVISADELRFELSETVLMEQPELAGRILAKLVEFGSAPEEDGAGHSGTDHLQRSPNGVLKIDKSFVTPLLDSTMNQEIVQSSIDLAHSLNMLVVAEGIENEAILRRLMEMKCDCGQGWLFGRPQPLADYLASESYASHDSTTLADEDTNHS